MTDTNTRRARASSGPLSDDQRLVHVHGLDAKNLKGESDLIGQLKKE